MKKLLCILLFAVAGCAHTPLRSTDAPSQSVAPKTNSLPETSRPAAAPAKAEEASAVKTAVDGYAARVNERVITMGNVRDHVQPVVQQIIRRYEGMELAEKIQSLYIDGREALIEQALLVEEARARNLSLPPQIVNEEAGRVIRTRFEGDRTLLNRTLALRKTTYAEWIDEVADQLVTQALYADEVMRRAEVQLDDVRAEYERTKEDWFIPLQVKFRVILINKGKTEEDQIVKREEVEAVRKRLLDGENFEDVAKEVSEGIRADDGGAFPWSEPENIRAELRPVLTNMPIGRISEPIETEDEFYLVKVDERRNPSYTPFDEVRPDIENRLLSKERKRLHERLMARLEAKHFVERY